MIKKISIFFILVPLIFSSQTKRFFYNVTFKTNAAVEESVQKDLVVLDISAEGNFFYSNEYLHVDSINKATNKNLFSYPNFKKIITWKKSDQKFEMLNNLSMNFYVFKSQKNIQWQLSEEKRRIGNFIVQKATCLYGGRKWNAWFTNEIPLPFGPYVFYGLPGLILEIADEDKDYIFSFVQNKNFEETYDTQKLLKKYLGIRKFEITEKEWRKIQMNFYENPIPEYKEGNAIMLKNDGTEYSSQDYKEVEKSIRENIKKNNNPIELDEKIDYR